MPLHSPGDFDPERIILYGGPASGKTTAWMGMADLALRTKADTHFYIIDNDNATSRAIANPDGKYHSLHKTNTTIYIPKSIDEYEGMTEEILGEVEPEDWIIVDMLSNVWDTMPDWWHQNVFGESSWDYWVTTRKMIVQAAAAGQGGHERQFGGDSGVDWQYIGKVYRAWEKSLSIAAPCHLLATSAETEIQDRYDKTGELGAQYAITNKFAPKVEKTAPHRFHTLMRISRKVSGQGQRKTFERKITMVKDRERDELWEELGGRGLTIDLPTTGHGWAMKYLVGVAGWKLGAAE